MVKRVTITVRGNEDDDIDLALDEALRLIKQGYLGGHNSNDTGGFYFTTEAEIPKSEYPA